MLVGCEMLSTDNDSNDKGNNEENSKLTLYQITEDIDAFESIFLAEDGNCLAIKKDTTFGYVAVIDSLKADDEKALVVYIDSLGKVRRVFNDGKNLDIAYNSEGYINLWYRDSEGTSEIFNDIKYTPMKAVTKAGEVFDPMDIGSVGMALFDLTDLKKAIKYDPVIGKVLKANVVTDLLTTGPFSNFYTEVLTGVTSVGIAALIGTNLPLAALLATINIAGELINDWQDMVANSYFGTAHPVTGEAVQLTDKHFVVSYSIADVDSGNTDFKVGVIVAEGKIFEDAMFITKNWHSYKKSEIYTGNNGHIIINLGDLNPKKGDKLKYRIYLEPADDNGFKWDDKHLDYWRYGAVKEFVIDEPALKIESAVQTNATTDDGYRYTFDVDVNVRNDIPFELDDWGVAIYTTSLDECTSEDQQYDIKSAKGNSSQTISFSIDVNDVMMDTEQTPYVPIMNHFAVPYISFDGHTYGIYDNAAKINLACEMTIQEDFDIIMNNSISNSEVYNNHSIKFQCSLTFEININEIADSVKTFTLESEGKTISVATLDLNKSRLLEFNFELIKSKNELKVNEASMCLEYEMPLKIICNENSIVSDEYKLECRYYGFPKFEIKSINDDVIQIKNIDHDNDYYSKATIISKVYEITITDAWFVKKFYIRGAYEYITTYLTGEVKRSFDEYDRSVDPDSWGDVAGPVNWNSYIETTTCIIHSSAEDYYNYTHDDSCNLCQHILTFETTDTEYYIIEYMNGTKISTNGFVSNGFSKNIYCNNPYEEMLASDYPTPCGL